MSNLLRDKIISIYHLLKVEDQVEVIVSTLAAAIIANGSIHLPNIQKVILVILFCLSSVTGTIIFNQYNDIEIDRINKPYRPLPSGIIKPKTALKIAFLSYVISFLLAIYLGVFYIIISVITIGMGIAYSHPPVGTRRNVIPSTILVSVGYAVITFVLGWSVYKSLLLIPWWFVAFLFVTDVGEVLTKDYRDVNGDKKAGFVTLPILLGYRKAATVNMVVYTLPFAGLIAGGLTGLISMKFSLLAVYCIPTGIYALSLLFRKGNHENAVRCYNILTINYYIIRILSLWAFIA